MKIENRGKKLIEADLVAFERKIGYRLPDSYRQFILVYNGGDPSPAYFRIPNWQYQQSLVNELKGIDPESEYVDLTKCIELMEDRIPKGFIPIGNDPGGNLILIGLEGATRGKIYFFDHENEPPGATNSLGDYPNIYILDDDFGHFLNNLTDEQSLRDTDIKG